jgi:hypothetical protein
MGIRNEEAKQRCMKPVSSLQHPRETLTKLAMELGNKSTTKNNKQWSEAVGKPSYMIKWADGSPSR